MIASILGDVINDNSANVSLLGMIFASYLYTAILSLIKEISFNTLPIRIHIFKSRRVVRFIKISKFLWMIIYCLTYNL